MTTQNKEIYKTRLRDNKFAARSRTQLWSEIPSPHNPYLAETCYCHGYNLIDLLRKRGFVEVLYLLFQGELPDKEQSQILESLMIGLINPGPRHPATRAAINTGIGKTDTAHILPIGLITLGGTHLGGNEVAASMRFLNKSSRKDPVETAKDLLNNTTCRPEGDWHCAPGFGTRFNGIDPLPKQIASAISRLPGCGKILQWANNFAICLEEEAGCGWLSTGVAAAVFSDLGFHPRAGAGLFQLINAPGLLAHGLEMANKPINAMPFIDNDHYVIKPKKRDESD